MDCLLGANCTFFDSLCMFSKGPIHFGDPLVISTSDHCFVAVEADGAVNSNRTGPVSLLMKWCVLTDYQYRLKITVLQNVFCSSNLRR
jgi:hypothetical protein